MNSLVVLVIIFSDCLKTKTCREYKEKSTEKRTWCIVEIGVDKGIVGELADKDIV